MGIQINRTQYKQSAAAWSSYADERLAEHNGDAHAHAALHIPLARVDSESPVVTEAQGGAPNGFARLTAAAKVETSQLPPITTELLADRSVTGDKLSSSLYDAFTTRMEEGAYAQEQGDFAKRVADGLAAAEADREEAEDAREQAEQERIAAERARAAAETERASAESARAAAETSRADAEQTRAANETARQNAEAARASAESGRAAQEEARTSAETARETAEDERAAAEAGRQAAIESKQNEWIATTSGSGSAYTVTLDPAPEALYVGMRITIIPHTQSTAASATLNVNGLGAKYFRQRGYSTGSLYASRISNFLTSGKPVGLVYDGTYWVMTEYSKPDWNDVQSKPSTFTPASHASTGTTYGAGTETQYGHVKLLNNLTTETAGAGALDAAQGKALADQIGDIGSVLDAINGEVV